ncbi:transglutaminase family protein [Meridianimarinicoccus roseus]|jgi:transglutaminase-like putative cysteine protease|uniref:Transglutaminase family protein n=1 Tax=Meridianimarinicoccus roseus TaxID=2072018 RepID=A0A2V2LES9_9RHOB|nr:transglutaminase family protein [Meridianimarinicoccus roseus]PWR04090.1 transglutaminase family protein [Meridianimarinicoccus roseus]
MKLKVSHTTVYRFEQPQKAVLQSHRLTPSHFAGQSRLSWSVDVPEGAVYGSRFRDGAGDETATMRFSGPVSKLTIHVHGTVETTDLAGVLRGHREKVAPAAYIRPTRMTRPDLAISELAATALAELDGGSALERAHALSGAVSSVMTYVPGTTNAQTTAAEALAGGEGVCQDFAHLLTAAAISVDIPARYVAGYLFSGDADGPAPEAAKEASPGTEAQTPMGPDSQASHAWAELFIEGLGWVGFDPSNECCPDARYIRLCSGFDAFDAAPIRGLSNGMGEEQLNVDVAVTQEQQ